MVGYGLGTKENLGKTVEDSFKLTLVSNKLTLHEVDIRKLRADIDGRSSLQYESSHERADTLHNQPYADRPDGQRAELSAYDASFSFLKRNDDKPVMIDYLNALKFTPEDCKSYFNPQRNFYVAICRDMMVISDLNKLAIECGKHEASEVVQVSYFQRKSECRAV